MKNITVATQKPYQVLIEENCLKHAGLYIREVTSSRNAVIVSDSNVSPLYGQILIDSLDLQGIKSRIFTFPAGETSKRLHTVEKLLSFMAQCRITRHDIIIALGGGVVGDITGFAAASYMRGIDYVQIPTSLLAQIDSSVGGKTGVDLPEGKNLAGAFWQPLRVIIDPAVLNTLPKRVYADGMGEAIKYGCIKDSALFERLLTLDSSCFSEDMIAACIDIKRLIVQQDERESGMRMLLNFGHTIGHAVEQHYRYETYTHGEAVGIGMYYIAKIGEALGITKQGCAAQIKQALDIFDLPHKADISINALANAILHDKKAESEHINFILLKDIGSSIIHPVKKDDIHAFLRADLEG